MIWPSTNSKQKRENWLHVFGMEPCIETNTMFYCCLWVIMVYRLQIKSVTSWPFGENNLLTKIQDADNVTIIFAHNVAPMSHRDLILMAKHMFCGSMKTMEYK